MGKKKSASEINAENSLATAFKDELQKSALDLALDYAEIGLDSIIENDALSEIPIVKTVLSFYKVGVSLRERDFIRKLLHFLHEFNLGQVSSEKAQKFTEKLEKDRPYREKVTEHVLLYVEKLETLDKAKILARLLLAHIQGHYDWEHFTHLSASLNRLHPYGLAILTKQSFESNPNQTLHLNPEQFEILGSAGLAFSQPQNVYTRTQNREDGLTQFTRDLTGFGGAGKTQNTNILSGTRNVYYLSTLGRDLYLLGIKNPASPS